MNEARLALRRRGRGPAVVFLGGCPTPWDVLSPLADAITTTHEAIEVALPGYGESAPLAGPVTLDASQALLEATLLAARITACTVVGFSSGSYRAFALALRGRVRVTRLLSLAGLAEFGDMAVGFRQAAAALRAGEDLHDPVGARFLSPSHASSHPEAVAEVRAWLDAILPDVLADELDAFAEVPDLTTALADLDIPIVARVGSADVAVPPAKSEAIVKACKDARFELVEGAGHALMLEDLDGTVASLRRLLARPSPRLRP